MTELGSSVALSSDGSRVAIGAPMKMMKMGTSSGHVKIYEWNGNAWDQVGGDISGNDGYSQRHWLKL